MRREVKAARGLYVGRFQPFHNGHLHAIKWILQRERELVIVIGSAQYAFTLRNPFTLGERVEMVTLALRAEGLLDRVFIVGVPDTGKQHSLWVPLVKMNSPSFNNVYTNDPLTRLLFEEDGYPVHPIPFYRRKTYEGTLIRRLMAENNKEWEELVPSSVLEFLKKIDGPARIRRLYEIESTGKSNIIY